MRVYLAAAMTSPNRELSTVQSLARALETLGLEVLTKHVAHPMGKERDRNLTDHELAKRDLNWLGQAHCLVAEVSTPSHGVGIEVMAAVQRGLPVLLLAREKNAVSRLLRGLPGVRFSWYRDGDDAVRIMMAFLQEVGTL
ncbi:MAG: nucleoside 2-deoxyribosyltransferase [Thermoanaerobaculaceae bacterium]